MGRAERKIVSASETIGRQLNHSRDNKAAAAAAASRLARVLGRANKLVRQLLVRGDSSARKRTPTTRAHIGHENDRQATTDDRRPTTWTEDVDDSAVD